jgi:Right handed beta helix region
MSIRTAFLRTFLAVAAAIGTSTHAFPATYYVRQTVGDDANDGTSPATAWRHLTKLWNLHPGDTAYVGPGLYREGIEVQNSGTAAARITFIADNTGKYTGDPPGRVMITGAEPVAGNTFVAASSPGVYSLHFPAWTVLGVAEMDSDQFRYEPARITDEHLNEKLTELQVVEKLPRHFYYDDKSRTLYIHTSDGKPPATHEIELFRRGYGIMVGDKHFVTVIGFTFRHMGDAGINFFKGSGDGEALFNTSYGSRQGIRVYAAPNMLVYGNTLFRNENCGVYFAAGSINGSALRNISYENAKGVRWSSGSGNAVALENVLFDNKDAGISIEETGPATVRSNILQGNRLTQLRGVHAEYIADDNCFQSTDPQQYLADFFPFPQSHRFKTLREYQDAMGQDLGSRENSCGDRTEKLDVHKMHADALAYRERALQILAATPSKPTVTPTPHP